MSNVAPFQLRRVRRDRQLPPPSPAADLNLIIPTLLLVIIGVIMVFSASYPLVIASRHQDAYYYVIRQAGFAVLGVCALFLIRRLPLEWLRKLSYPLLGLSIFLLLAVLVVGRDINGARSWFSFGGFSFQPSELAKVALMLALANLLATYPNLTSTFRGLLLALAMAGVVFILVLAGKDFGTTMVTALAVFALFFLAGANLRHLGVLAGAGLILGVLLILKEPYRLARIICFLNPTAYADSGGYQITRSLIAIGSGGIFGRGFSLSREKFFYLPTPHTDSIFAVIGEELGLVFCLGLLALFLWLGWRGLKISASSPDRFCALAAAGMTNIILIQAATNLFVIMGWLPPTGLPLPFISYGGSALLFNLAAVGVIANVSRFAAVAPAGARAGYPALTEITPATTEDSPMSGKSKTPSRRHSLRPRGF